VVSGFLVKVFSPCVKEEREPLSYAGLNTVGLMRRGFTKETLDEIAKLYHILFVQGLSTSKAVETIENSLPASALKEQVLSFVKKSTIGIIKRHKDTTIEDFAF